MDIVQVILLTLVIQAAGLFYESSLKTTWYNASRICSIALPDINVRESGNYIDTEYQIKNDKVWVGYLKKTTSFEYIGCTSTESLHITKSIPIAKNTPGLCYTFCKNKKNIAGLSGDKCYCLSEVPNGDIRQPHCNWTCDIAGLACGGDGYISLYNARNDITASPDEERCYAFQYGEWTGWEECYKPHRAFCIKNNTILEKGYHAWNEYTNLCFSLQGDIVAFEDKRNITNATGPSWRNIVSSTAFYTYKDVLPDSAIKFGYVTKEKLLKFESNGNKGRHVLCSNESSSAIPTSPSSMSSTSASVKTSYSTYGSSETMPTNDRQTESSSAIPTSPSSMSSTSASVQTSYSTYGSSQTMPTNDSQTESSSTIPTSPSSMSSTSASVQISYSTYGSSQTMPTNDRQTDIGVPIGISVVVLVLAVCGILAFLYLRRSDKLTKCCMNEQQPKAEPDKERSQSSRNVNTFVNSSYDHHSLEAAHLKDVSQEETVANRDSFKMHTYMVIENVDSQPVDECSTYNTTTATVPRFSDAQDANVYNTLALDSNAAYSNVHTKKMLVKGQDQIYNTLTGAQTTNAGPSGNYTTDEDTYNHINSNSVTNSIPDSLYDISDQNTYTSGLEQSDTYSHLTEASRSKSKTEN